MVVDAAWAAPSAAADVGENAWEEPVEQAEVEDWDAPEVDAHGWDGAVEEPDDCDGVGAGEDEQPADAGPEPADELSIAGEVTAWLEHLSLAEHRAAVLQWCEDMGAATLDEVVDSVEDLAESLALKPIPTRRLLNRAGEAMEAVRRGGAAATTGGQRTVSAATDAVADADGAGSHPGATSFYSAYSSTSTTAAHSQAQSFYGSRGELPPGDEAQEDDEPEYLKQEPTQRATWTPKAKVGQSSRKKQQRQASVAESAPGDQADEAAKRAEDAARLFEQQLREEEQHKSEEAQAAIAEAIDSEDPERLKRAIQEARAAGIDARDVKDAEDALKRTVRKQKQRRENAVCALQAVLEAPRDEVFATNVRAAIEAAADARSMPGCAQAICAAEAALREWELQEQRRGEAKMALQLTIRSRDAQALRAALDEAHEAGLSGSRLAVEAEQVLHEVQAREQADAAAANRLRRAMDTRDLQALEEAVEVCTARSLRLFGADTLLERLREEERLRTEASEQLYEAMEGQDARLIKAALGRARTVGVVPAEIAEGEARVAELEVAFKRRENANVELFLARNARDARRLEVAIAEGRRAGLGRAELAEAEEELREAVEVEQRRDAVRKSLSDAIAQRDLGQLRSALQAAEGVMPLDCQEVAAATAAICRLEEEARRAEEARARAAAEAKLRRAVEAGDWDGIEAGQKAARHLGFAEDSDLLRLAANALDELREAHELEEAERIASEAKQRLAELQRREAELAGPAHKKERAAIGKEIMALRNNAENLSALRFLKDPEKERQRRVERAHEIEKAAEEERQRRERRQVEARAELDAAFQKRDEDAVRALIVEGMLNRVDSESAAAFLSEVDQRRESADKDAMILEFSFDGLDRRDFFKASTAMNELFYDKYAMQEGVDFKLKVVKACNSVLVAFRSRDFARAVLATARSAAAGGVVAEAELRDAMAFSAEVEESLPALRQDAQNLQRKPARPEAEAAVRSMAQRGGGPPEEGGAAGGRPLAAAGSAGRRASPGAAWGLAAPPVRAATTAPGYPAAAAGQPASRPGRGGRGAVRWSSGPLETELDGTSSSSCYPSRGKGVGKGAGAGPANLGDEDVISLSRQAATLLQRDRATAATFHSDLKTFEGRFRVSAEVRGADVVMRPMGMVHKEALRQARAELQGLLNYYFPAEREPKRRWVKLRVDPTHGAGIEATPCEQGYRIDHVESFPGQDFVPGEIVVEIESRPLAGLPDAEMEDTFGECFRNGALVCLVKEG